MATSSNFTLEQLKALECAIAEGTLTVKYSDKLVTYRSLDEMLKIRKLMRSCLGLIENEANKSKGRRIKMEFSKGDCE